MKIDKKIMSLSNKRHPDALTSPRVRAILSDPEMSDELSKKVKEQRKTR